MQTFSDSDANILIMSETWHACPTPGKLDTFSASLREFALAESIEDVNILSKARTTGKRGGGLALLTKESITFKYYKLDIMLPESFEYLAAKCICASPFVMICFYHPPGTSFSLFMQEFEDLLDALNFLPLPSMICGDFNIKMNLSNDYQTVAFSNLLYEYNFRVLMSNSATQCCGNTLDFVLCSPSLFDRCGSISVDNSTLISDHYPVLFHVLLSPSPNTTFDNRRSFRPFRSMDKDAFAHDLASSLQTLAHDDNLSFGDYLIEYNDTIKSVVDTHAPLRVKSGSQRTKPGWMDNEYVKARALRKRLQKLSDKTQYNIQNRLCAQMAQSKREAYNCSLIQSLESGKQSEFYKVLNKLVGKGLNKPSLPSHDDPLTLANSFNHFFVQKVTNIRESLPVYNAADTTSSISSGSSSNGQALTSFTPTDELELLNIIAEHGVKTNPDDPLPDFIVQEHLGILLPHLVSLVNLSLSSASCDGIKEAYVVPILKSLTSDHDVFKNYRPVSLLSFVSKLTERVVHARITDHLTVNDLHNAAQYGYKKHHSCETLLLKLVDDLLVAIDKRSGVVVLFLDLSAAFDTVDHGILLGVLQNKFHITGSALDWIDSFLSGRSQRVKIGDVFSLSLLIAYGVAQGSILGPLLFNLYCSTIYDVFTECGFKSMGYADDNFGLRIFPAFSAPSTLFMAIPHCLRLIKLWAAKHFLKLNGEKTEVMLFGDDRFFSECVFRTFRDDMGTIMPISNTAKLLGVTLDKNLCFDRHVSDIVSSMNYVLRNIRLIRKCLDLKAAQTLVHSLITNKLDQCNSLFMGISQSNLSKLQRLQNNALRLVLQLPPRSHNISVHMKEMHWLPVRSRIIFKYLVTVFKCISGVAPTQLSGKIRIKCPLNMILKSDLYRPSTVFGKRSFTYLAPRYWNGLPRNLRIIPDLMSFKSHLKAYLFDNVSNFLHRVDPYTSFAISQPGDLTAVFTTERHYVDEL